MFRVTEVQVSFTTSGWPIPSRLRWDGQSLFVVDVGRRWHANDGIHVLVRVAGERVFELHTNGSLWRAKLVSEPPHFA